MTILSHRGQHASWVTLTADVKESSNNKVEIQDFDSSVVEAMLRFMYCFDYNNESGTSSMIYDAQVYQAADKYDIPSLKKHAKGKFKAAISAGWSLDDFSGAIFVAYDSTPSTDRGLRDLIVKTSRDHINELLENELFRELLRKTPDFAADLIPSLCRNLSISIRRYDCPSCGNRFSADFSNGNYYCPSCSSRRSNWESYRA